MIHIMNKRKTSPSRLRQEHMERTRDLIMEGLIRTMANGAVTWSIPEVAREAGVSVPTIYRYFRTKQELVEGLSAYVVRKAGLAAMQLPRSPQELVAMVREMYIRSEGMSDAMKMASVSELAQEIRKESIPVRLKMIEAALAPVLPSFSPGQRPRTGNRRPTLPRCHHCPRIRYSGSY
jgi:AcrR family transcriptional regulator